MNLEALQCPCCKKDGVIPKLIEKLLELEAKYGAPLWINSGYRCAAHNAKVGGAPRSMHLLGKAVDLATKKADQERLIALAISLGWGGVGRGKTFTHLDLGARRQWKY